MPIIGLGLLVPVALVILWFLSGIRIVNEYEQGVVLRLGRFAGVRNAGLKWIIPFIDRMIIIDMRVTAEQVPPQDVITRDNVSVKVNAVIYFRVMQADRAFLQVTDFLFATSQFAQTTLRSVLGQVDMDDLLSQRDKINRQLQEIIDRHTEPWGVKVTAVEAAAVALAACGEPRVVEAPSGGTSGCASCHTAPGEGPPFRDQTGSTDPGRLTVGAHDAHLHGDIVASISCDECHTVPRTIADSGHLQDSPGDIRFGPLPRTGGAQPRYEATGCAASYCHGNFPGGNADNTPRWLGGRSAALCGSCHALPPATGQHA